MRIHNYSFIRNLETDKKVRVFVSGKPFQLSAMEQPNLFGQFLSYEENWVLWIRYQMFQGNFDFLTREL